MEKRKTKEKAVEESTRYNYRVNRVAKILRETSRQLAESGVAFDTKDLLDSRILARNIVENGL